MTFLVLGALAGIFLTAQAARTGTDQASGQLPEAVERLIPNPGDEVLSQARVGIQVKPGHDATLVINGTEVREGSPGLSKDLGLGLIQFQPGADTELGGLLPQRNCVVAMVWRQAEGPDAAEPVSWCFNAT